MNIQGVFHGDQTTDTYKCNFNQKLLELPDTHRIPFVYLTYWFANIKFSNSPIVFINYNMLSRH